jgi:hypothetical protein
VYVACCCRWVVNCTGSDTFAPRRQDHVPMHSASSRQITVRITSLLAELASSGVLITLAKGCSRYQCVPDALAALRRSLCRSGCSPVRHRAASFAVPGRTTHTPAAAKTRVSRAGRARAKTLQRSRRSCRCFAPLHTSTKQRTGTARPLRGKGMPHAAFAGSCTCA